MSNTLLRIKARFATSHTSASSAAGLAIAAALASATPAEAQTAPSGNIQLAQVTLPSGSPIVDSRGFQNCLARNGGADCEVSRIDERGGAGIRTPHRVWSREANIPAAGTRERFYYDMFNFVHTGRYGSSWEMTDRDGDGLQEYRPSVEALPLRESDINASIYIIDNQDNGTVEVVSLNRTPTNYRFQSRTFRNVQEAERAFRFRADKYYCTFRDGQFVPPEPPVIQVPPTPPPTINIPPEQPQIPPEQPQTPPEVQGEPAFGLLLRGEYRLGASDLKPFDGALAVAEGQVRVSDNFLGGELRATARASGGTPGGPNRLRLGDANVGARLDTERFSLSIAGGRMAAGNGVTTDGNFTAMRFNADNDGLYTSNGGRLTATFRPSENFSITGGGTLTERFREFGGAFSLRVNNHITANGEITSTRRNDVQRIPGSSGSSLVAELGANYDLNGRPGGAFIGPRVTWGRSTVELTTPAMEQRSTARTLGAEAGTTFGDGRFALSARADYGRQPERFNVANTDFSQRRKGTSFSLNLRMNLGSSRTSSAAPAHGWQATARPLEMPAPQPVTVNGTETTAGQVDTRVLTSTRMNAGGMERRFADGSIDVINRDGRTTYANEQAYAARLSAAPTADPQLAVGERASLGRFDAVTEALDENSPVHDPNMRALAPGQQSGQLSRAQVTRYYNDLMRNGDINLSPEAVEDCVDLTLATRRVPLACRGNADTSGSALASGGFRADPNRRRAPTQQRRLAMGG